MFSLIPFVVALSSSAFPAHYLDIRGSVIWNDICPGINKLGSSKVFLDDGKFSGSILRNGSFLIPDVPAGTYILSVLSHDYVFDQLRLDVLDADPLVAEVHPYIPGTPLNPSSTVSLPYPIKLAARQRHEYFVPHESFSLLAMFQSPMMLMMLFTAGMLLAMPYMMKNMDLEAAENKHQNQPGSSSAMPHILTGGERKTGSHTIDDGASQIPSTKTPSQPLKTRTNKARRR